MQSKRSCRSQEKDRDVKILQDHAKCTYSVRVVTAYMLLYVCGQDVELETSTRGTLLVVLGSSPARY